MSPKDWEDELVSVLPTLLGLFIIMALCGAVVRFTLLGLGHLLGLLKI